MQDFDSSLERVVAGMQSRRALTDHEKRVVAYHEAGHALCGELLPSVDRVHRISIVPRGRALGYTLNLPEEDRYLKTREELIDFMTMLLGGRAAEQLVFGSITTGASDDLKRVAEIAHAMVHDYAMGTGITSLRIVADGPASEASRRVRDEEVRDLADEAFRTATSILDSHRAELDQLAATLLANEVLERRRHRRDHGRRPERRPAADRPRRDRDRGSHRREAGGALAEALSAQFSSSFRPFFARSLPRVRSPQIEYFGGARLGGCADRVMNAGREVSRRDSCTWFPAPRNTRCTIRVALWSRSLAPPLLIAGRAGAAARHGTGPIAPPRSIPTPCRRRGHTMTAASAARARAPELVRAWVTYAESNCGAREPARC